MPRCLAQSRQSRGGEEENQKEQRGAGGGGAGPSKYQELGESGMLKEKDIARRRNATQALSVVLGHDSMQRPAEGSLDAAEQDRLSEGREGRRACRKEEETNVSDCVAVQCKDWVEGVSWGKNKNQNSSLVPCHGKVLPSWWVTAVGCSLWLRRANGWFPKCCKIVLVEVLFRAIDRQ